MNPAFAILVIIFCFLLWVSLRHLYRKLGRKISKVGYEISDAVNEQEYDILETEVIENEDDEMPEIHVKIRR